MARPGATHHSHRQDRANARLGQVSQQPLEYGTNASGDNDAVTVGSASGALVAADATGVGRVVEIYVPGTADTGIHVAFGEAATTDHWLIPAGASASFPTTQAINAIRGGASDVTARVLVGKVA